MTDSAHEKSGIRPELEALSNRLYHLQHRTRFIADLAGATPSGKQADALLAESVQVVFCELSDELEYVQQRLADLANQSAFFGSAS